METDILPEHPQSFITLRHAHENRSFLETLRKMQSRAGKGSWGSGPDTQPGELLWSLSSQAFPSPKKVHFHSWCLISPLRRCQCLRETKCPCSIQHSPLFQLCEFQRRNICSSFSRLPDPTKQGLPGKERSSIQSCAGTHPKVVFTCT